MLAETMPLMPLDSAWRQWRNSINQRKDAAAAESGEPLASGRAADTDRATAAETQASAVWLQTALGHFERRRTQAIEDGHDVTTDKALKALGVPCAGCLGYAKTGDVVHTIVRDDGKRFPVTAMCGRPRVDPTVDPMPTW